MIRMIQGSTRIGSNIYSASSGAFSADEATEKRLVSLGVAEYVTGTPLSPAEQGVPDAGSLGGGYNHSGETTPPAGEETGEKRELDQMTVAELRALMKERGLSARVGIRKDEMIKALDEYDREHQTGGDADEDEPEGEDGDQPPELGAEAPEV